MAAIKGSAKVIAMGLAGTFATPVALGAGSKLEVESYNDNENTTELTTNPIGGGVLMETDTERGVASPTIDLSGVVNYDGPVNEAIKQFFGTTAVSTVDAGVYDHTFVVNTTFNSEFLTVADQKTTTEAVEYPSAVVTSLNFTVNPNDYMRFSANLLANLQDLTPTQNDVAQLANATIADSTRVVARPDDLFRINAKGGAALSGSDNLSISGATLDFTKPQEHVPEIRGVAGNSEPESSDGIPFAVTLTVNRKNQPNLDFMTAHQEGTEYKASLEVSGPIISGSDVYKFTFYFPRLKVVTPVSASANSAGRNPESITFKALVETGSQASGMDSLYPYIVVRNTRSTVYAA